jgi:hypothetical protein
MKKTQLPFISNFIKYENKIFFFEYIQGKHSSKFIDYYLLLSILKKYNLDKYIIDIYPLSDNFIIDESNNIIIIDLECYTDIYNFYS